MVGFGGGKRVGRGAAHCRRNVGRPGQHFCGRTAQWRGTQSLVSLAQAHAGGGSVAVSEVDDVTSIKVMRQMEDHTTRDLVHGDLRHQCL